MGKKKNKNRKGSGAGGGGKNSNNNSAQASPDLAPAHSGNALVDSVQIDESKLPQKELPPVAVSPQQKAYDDTPASAEKRKGGQAVGDDTLARAETAAAQAKEALDKANRTPKANGALEKTIAAADAASAAAKEAVQADPDGAEVASALDAAGKSVPKSIAQAQDASKVADEAANGDVNRSHDDMDLVDEVAASPERLAAIARLSGELVAGISDAVALEIKESGDVQVSPAPNMDFGAISSTDIAEARKSMLEVSEEPAFRLSLQPNSAAMAALRQQNSSHTPLSSTKSGSGRAAAAASPFASVKSSAQAPGMAQQYDANDFGSQTPQSEVQRNLDSEIEKYVQDVVEGKDPTPLGGGHGAGDANAPEELEDDFVEVDVTYDENGRMSVMDITESGVPFYRHDMDDFMRERRKMSLRSELEDVTSHKIKRVAHLIGAGQRKHEALVTLDPHSHRKMTTNEADDLLNSIRELDESIMKHTPGKTPQPLLSPATKRAAERKLESPVSGKVSPRKSPRAAPLAPELELVRSSPYTIPRHVQMTDGENGGSQGFLTKAALNELRAMTNPPSAVKVVLAALTVLIGEEGVSSQADFGTKCLKTIRDQKLLEKLVEFDPASITDKKALDLRPFTADPAFNEQKMNVISRASCSLLKFVLHHESEYYKRTGKTPLTVEEVEEEKKRNALRDAASRRKTAYKSVASKVKVAWVDPHNGPAMRSEPFVKPHSQQNRKPMVVQKPIPKENKKKVVASGPPRVATIAHRTAQPSPAPQEPAKPKASKEISEATKQRIEALAVPAAVDTRKQEIAMKKKEFLDKRPDSKNKGKRPSTPNGNAATNASPPRVAMIVEPPAENRRKEIEEKKKAELARRSRVTNKK